MYLCEYNGIKDKHVSFGANCVDLDHVSEGGSVASETAGRQRF